MIKLDLVNCTSVDFIGHSYGMIYSYLLCQRYLAPEDGNYYCNRKTYIQFPHKLLLGSIVNLNAAILTGGKAVASSARYWLGFLHVGMFEVVEAREVQSLSSTKTT